MNYPTIWVSSPRPKVRTRRAINRASTPARHPKPIDPEEFRDWKRLYDCRPSLLNRKTKGR